MTLPVSLFRPEGRSTAMMGRPDAFIAAMAFAGHHGDAFLPQRTELPFHFVDNSFAGVFHQTNGGDVPLVNRGSIQGPHFRRGDQFHQVRRAFISRTACSSPTKIARAMILWPMLYSTISVMFRSLRTFR